jgi:hypothetical protein
VGGYFADVFREDDDIMVDPVEPEVESLFHFTEASVYSVEALTYPVESIEYGLKILADVVHARRELLLGDMILHLNFVHFIPRYFIMQGIVLARDKIRLKKGSNPYEFLFKFL